MTERLVDHIVQAFKREQGEDLRRNAMAMQRVMEAAEQAKKELSAGFSAQINLPFISQNSQGPVHLDMTVTRAEFEQMTRDLVERTTAPVRMALDDAGIAPSELWVCFAGGRFDAYPCCSGTRTPHHRAKSPLRRLTPMNAWQRELPFRVIRSLALLRASFARTACSCSM